MMKRIVPQTAYLLTFPLLKSCCGQHFALFSRNLLILVVQSSISFAVIFFSFSTSWLFAQQPPPAEPPPNNTFTMTTYYPAPFGAYDTIQLVPKSSSFTPPNPCRVGTMYVDSDGKLQYCQNSSGTSTWGPIDQVWTQSGNNIYPADTASNSNLMVGIGTTSPFFRLTVEGDTSAITQGADISQYIALGNKNAMEGARNGIAFYNSSAGMSQPDIASAYINMVHHSDHSSDLVFGTDRGDFTGDKMIITSTGNVGIGTTSPRRKLHIFGQILSETKFVDPSPSVYESPSQYILQATDASSTKGTTVHKIFGPYKTSGELYIGAGRSAGDNSRNGITLYNLSCSPDTVGGTDYNCNVPNVNLLADKTYMSGNVGIGTTEPVFLLHVVNPSETNWAQIGVTGGAVAGGTLRLADSGASTANTALDSIPNSSQLYTSASGGLTIYTGVASPIRFATSGISFANERMRIDSAGNVGIGTTNPQAKLDIGGTPGVDGIRFPDGTVQKTAAGDSSSHIACPASSGYCLVPATDKVYQVYSAGGASSVSTPGVKPSSNVDCPASSGYCLVTATDTVYQVYSAGGASSVSTPGVKPSSNIDCPDSSGYCLVTAIDRVYQVYSAGGASSISTPGTQ